MTRQLISTNKQPLLRSSHAKRPPQSGLVQVGLPVTWIQLSGFPVNQASLTIGMQVPASDSAFVINIESCLMPCSALWFFPRWWWA